MPITEIADLPTVRNYLRISNPMQAAVDDAVLQVFMASATEVVERELGHIVAKNVTAERHDGGGCAIWLRELPVLYVTNVEEGWGYFNQELDDQLVNQQPALSIWAYSLDQASEGLITRRAAGNVMYPFVRGRNNIRVDYTVGRLTLPANAQLAFLELVGHWYRTSQLRTGNQASAAYSPNQVISQDFTRTTGLTSINMGVPLEVLELLKADRRRPIIS
jgi:hypothetical protein